MNYGNKIIFIFACLSFLFIVGCETRIRDFHYDLYDGYSIKAIDNKIKLYKNDEVIKIENDDYKISEFKYNSDVVCLKLQNGKYYMIYYYNAGVFGPYTKDSLEDTINNDPTMEIEEDFKNILKVDVTYDE